MGNTVPMHTALERHWLVESVAYAESLAPELSAEHFSRLDRIPPLS